MAARARHGTYIFQRPGSNNWQIRLRSGGERKEISLRTTDKDEATIRAQDYIGEHKVRLIEARPRLEPTWVHLYAPGREHAGEDGGRIFATDRELYHLDAGGVTVRTTPNGAPGWQAVGLDKRLGLPSPMNIGHVISIDEAAARPSLAVKNGDDAILETYIAQNNLAPYFAADARKVWAIWRQLTGGKVRLKDASRDDGRKLVAHFEAQGLKSASIKKKVGWLRAAVKLAMAEKDSPLKFNPFAGVLPKKNDKVKRLPLDDADMKMAASNLELLSEPDRLLFRLLACTGMRLSEALEIDHEQKENGVRFVIVGTGTKGTTKTDQSERRVPLPAGVLPFLPKVIKGPLFKSTSKNPENDASHRLNAFLKAIGVHVPNVKVVHSLRHRAQDRLRAAGCPQDIREQLLGHEQMTVGEGYGKGSPVPLLKRWLDKVGF
jgi:integrase